MGFGRRQSKKKKKHYYPSKPMISNGKGAYCFYCQRILKATTDPGPRRATRDHVNPKSNGGGKRVWACFECNQRKGSTNFMTFLNTFWRE